MGGHITSCGVCWVPVKGLMLNEFRLPCPTRVKCMIRRQAAHFAIADERWGECVHFPSVRLPW